MTARVVDKDYINLCKAKAEKIKQERVIYQKKLSELNDAYRTLQLLVIKELWGIEQGDVVKGVDGKFYLVTSIDIRQWGAIFDDVTSRPWLKGYRMRKDGTYGTIECNLYENWTLVDE